MISDNCGRRTEPRRVKFGVLINQTIAIFNNSEYSVYYVAQIGKLHSFVIAELGGWCMTRNYLENISPNSTISSVR